MAPTVVGSRRAAGASGLARLCSHVWCFGGMTGRLGSAGTVPWSPSCGLPSMSVFGEVGILPGDSEFPGRMLQEAS